MNELSSQQESRRGRKREKTQGTAQLEVWQAAFELENSNHKNGSSPGPLSKQAEANQSEGDQRWQRKVQEEAEVIKKK